MFELYPATNNVIVKQAYHDLFGDIIFNCPTLTLDSQLSSAGQATWMYLFDHTLSACDAPTWRPYREPNASTSCFDEGGVMRWSASPELLSEPIREGRCVALEEMSFF